MRRWMLIPVVGLVLLPLAGFFVVPSLMAWMDEHSEPPPPNQYQPTDLPPSRQPLPTEAEMLVFANEDPIKFLEACERKYDRDFCDRDVPLGYSMIMQKQERIDGNLGKVEKLQVYFREKPYSVSMRFLEGGFPVKAVLYVEGENQKVVKDKLKSVLVVKPVIPGVALQERDPEGAEALKSGRFPLTQFGLKKGLQRTRTTWEVAREKNDLKVNYLGVKPLPQAGDRECHIFHRPRYETPDNDGVADLTVWIDAKTWYQVGILARNRDGEIVGEYYFRDIQPLDVFNPNQFTRDGLK